MAVMESLSVDETRTMGGSEEMIVDGVIVGSETKGTETGIETETATEAETGGERAASANEGGADMGAVSVIVTVTVGEAPL
jgi:hypothetical protein